MAAYQLRNYTCGGSPSSGVYAIGMASVREAKLTGSSRASPAQVMGGASLVAGVAGRKVTTVAKHTCHHA